MEEGPYRWERDWKRGSVVDQGKETAVGALGCPHRPLLSRWPLLNELPSRWARYGVTADTGGICQARARVGNGRPGKSHARRQQDTYPGASGRPRPEPPVAVTDSPTRADACRRGRHDVAAQSWNPTTARRRPHYRRRHFEADSDSCNSDSPMASRWSAYSTFGLCRQSGICALSTSTRPIATPAATPKAEPCPLDA